MVNSEAIHHSDNLKISTTSATFGLLRKTLISNLGMKRAKVILLKYGWDLGAANARKVLQNPASLEEMLNKVGLIQLQNGQISKVDSKRILKIKIGGQISYINATGKWEDSYEVNEHLENYGLANAPVCHTLAGLGSGFASIITDRKVFLKEVKCRAMGHEECCYEIRVEEEWQNDSEMLEEIRLYRECFIDDAFNTTDEELLDQRNYIEKVTSFHDTLTTLSIEGHTMEESVRTVSDILDIPVVIEDLNFQPRFYVGIEQDTYEALNKDFLNYLPRTNFGQVQSPAYDTSSIIRGRLHNRLVAPIIVQNQPIGYISFVYTDKSIEFEKDRMFLWRAASTIANNFFGEKGWAKDVEMIKGNFFDQLLLGRYVTESNLINQAFIPGIDLKKAFYIASLQISPNGLDTNMGEFQKLVRSSIIRYVEIQSYQILITLFDNQIVMLFPKVKKLHIKLENILFYLTNQFRQEIFRIGLSNESETIDNISDRLEEAQMVLKINRRDPIAFYEDTNIIGTLINSKNISTIRQKAQRELQPILQLKKLKRDELMKTMYVFLLNGGNLQQSSNDLELSMSGLLYRISKIEKLLNKQLRNPQSAYELMLMLEALKVLGDIEV